jgi:hypothetical protein
MVRKGIRGKIRGLIVVKKKWEVEVIENITSDDFDLDIYEQMLVEVAGVIYSDLCQLPKVQLSDSFNDEINFLQRTGTDA